MSITPSATVNRDELDDTTFTECSHWGVWGTIIWSVLVLAIFFALPILTLALIVLINNGPLPESELSQSIASAATNGNTFSVTVAVTSIVCLGVVVGAVKLKRGSVSKEYFAIKVVPWKIMVKWIALLAGFIALYELVAVSLGHTTVPDFMTAAYATANPLLFWVAMIVVGPLFEEAFFRGFLLKGLTLSFLGPIGAVVVTATLWMAIHLEYDSWELAYILCLGLLLGTARILAGSILVPFGLHAINNVLATLGTAFQS